MKIYVTEGHVRDVTELAPRRELDADEGGTAPEGVVPDGQDVLRDHDLCEAAFVEAQL